MSKGIKGTTGIIQYTSPDRIESIRKHAMERAFKFYIKGFTGHTFEVVRTCPDCGEKHLKAERVGWNKAGFEALYGEISLSLHDLDSCFVIANWKCDKCGEGGQNHVSFRVLLEDFNNPALRKHNEKNMGVIV